MKQISVPACGLAGVENQPTYQRSATMLGGIRLRRLADAWHKRVMADDVVAHAFSHGFHPQHVERLAIYWAD
jgi:hypothetical protein